MSPMHPDEIRPDVPLVCRLIAEQCPQWAGRAVVALPREVEGTDHILFRLGEDLLVRMPKIGWAGDQGLQEARWLPALVDHVPAGLAVPRFVGEPTADYPWSWTVVPWFPGSTPPRLGSDDPALALELAVFARALHTVPAQGGPLCPPGSRGTHPGARADKGRAAIAALRGWDDGLDLDAIGEVWEQVVATPPYDAEPSWLHGDLQPGNLIVDASHLRAVIDFTPRRGDPAPDLAPVWWTFTGRARAAYREAMADYGEDAWWRARGWAILPSLTGIDYYRNSFPRMAEHGRRTIRAVLDDLAANAG